MKTLSLRKQTEQAPKYVLKIGGLDLYVADKQALSGVKYTPDIKKALKYSVGFDNEAVKTKVWNTVAKIQHNCEVNFEIVYL